MEAYVEDEPFGSVKEFQKHLVLQKLEVENEISETEGGRVGRKLEELGYGKRIHTRRRSLAEAASYRVFATSLVVVIAFLYTGALRSSAKIGVSAAVAKTTRYFHGERVWNNIQCASRSPRRSGQTWCTLFSTGTEHG